MTSDAKPIRVYKASAGSGKTFTLAAEFIANLLNDFNPVDNAHRHQLAITFTKKATNEMKERILQYLFELAYVDDLTKGGILDSRSPSAISISVPAPGKRYTRSCTAMTTSAS